MQTTFTHLQQAVKEINNDFDGIYDLEVKIAGDDVYVIDTCEEFYYDGFQFEKVESKLVEALKKDTGDSGAYMDCVCQGRFICDFKKGLNK